MNPAPKSYSELSDFRAKLKLQNKKTVQSLPQLVAEKILQTQGKRVSPGARFAAKTATDLVPFLLKKTKYPKTGQQILKLLSPFVFSAIEKSVSGRKKPKQK